MLILIPPSEGKTKVKSTGIRFEKTNFQFEDEVKKIVFLLENLSELGEDLSSIYGTSQEKSELFHRQNQDVFNSRCAMAIQRYTGVVYEHINWDSMSDNAKKYMIKHIRIFSGLFGMTTPLTLIPDYKLKMNVLSLQNHWSPVISDALKIARQENLLESSLRLCEFLELSIVKGRRGPMPSLMSTDRL